MRPKNAWLFSYRFSTNREEPKRVVFVGLRNKLFEFPAKQKKAITCEMALSDLPPLENELGCEDVAYAMPAQNSYQRLMRKHSTCVKNHIAAKHSEQVRKIISLVPDGKNYKTLPEAFQDTRNFHVAWTRFNNQQPAPTIDTGHRHHFHYKYNRVPTVRECAGIQSFPDDFVFPHTAVPKEDNFTPISLVVDNTVSEKYFFSSRAVQGMLRKQKNMKKGRVQELSAPCNTVGAHLAK